MNKVTHSPDSNERTHFSTSPARVGKTARMVEMVKKMQQNGLDVVFISVPDRMAQP